MELLLPKHLGNIHHKAVVFQSLSVPLFSNPTDCSPPGSFVCGILQARMLVIQSLSHVQLCDPMDCSTPGFPVLHHLPELAQTYVHWVSEAIPSSVIPFSSRLLSFPASGSFPMSWPFALGSQNMGVSASVLPMNIQGWFPLRLTGLSSLQSKGLSRVFSNTKFKSH